MLRINKNKTGVANGSLILFSDYQHDGVMWTGTGPREFRRVVEFDEVFARAPVVTVSISMWDFEKATNQRADISSEMVNSEGFVIVFRTWGDTRIARIRADWLAIGEVADDDDWDVV